MKHTSHPIGFPYLEKYPDLKVLSEFEGGRIFKSVKENEYILVIDNGSMASFLDEEDQDLLNRLVSVYEFDTEEELNNYIEDKRRMINRDGG